MTADDRSTERPGFLAFLRRWYRRTFDDPQVVILTLMLFGGALIAYLMARTLAPVLASMIIAYLLEGQVSRLVRRQVPRVWAVAAAFSLFMALLFGVLFGLLPLLSQQIAQLFQELPGMIAQFQDALLTLPDRYPTVFNEEQVRELIRSLRTQATRIGREALSTSIGLLPGAVAVLVYLILMPLLVFFFLKDKARILDWLGRFLPRDRKLASQVWREVDEQIGNYVRGKFWEILIIGTIATVTFVAMGLNYAFLLGVLVGISVLIPYIGATVMTIPVVAIAYFQWGWSPEAFWTFVAYLIIQALDGNLLVPLLFGEIVNLHPVAIIVAVLFFGSLWGFWGIFFAIPLATVVKAVLNAWPTRGGNVSAKALEAEHPGS